MGRLVFVGRGEAGASKDVGNGPIEVSGAHKRLHLISRVVSQSQPTSRMRERSRSRIWIRIYLCETGSVTFFEEQRI